MRKNILIRVIYTAIILQFFLICMEINQTKHSHIKPIAGTVITSIETNGWGIGIQGTNIGWNKTDEKTVREYYIQYEDKCVIEVDKETYHNNLTTMDLKWMKDYFLVERK